MKWWVLGSLLVLACGGASTAEQDGDKAWHAGQWALAMSSYQAAGESPRLLAKYADAALRGDFLPEAVQGWSSLGKADRTRVTEAAAGLARTALAAERTKNPVALALALAALRQAAPEWPAGRLVRHLDTDRGLTPQQAVGVWLLALATETDQEASAKALLSLAEAVRAQGDCPGAIRVYQSASHRTTGALKDSAVTSMARCELGLGLAALAQSHDDEAEGWFDQTLRHDPNGTIGRRALVGLGDARVRQGDLASAVIAWRAVLTAPVPPDSVYLLALERLQAATVAPPDTSLFAPGWP